MKFVTKGFAPLELGEWLVHRAQGAFSDLNQSVRSAWRLRLLQEQGYLCAYTMMRIKGDDQAHIEHIVPQHQDRSRQLDHSNVVACYPARRQEEHAAFGAFAKGGTEISSTNFVKPTAGDCEGQFKYLPNGDVVGLTAPAKSTIEILKLNHSKLKALRAQAVRIKELTSRVRSSRYAVRELFENEAFEQSGALDAQEARELAYDIVRLDQDGKFPGFCFAIRQVALAYAANSQAKSRINLDRDG